MLLSGKSALVTGAAGGIGRASALALARAGAKVFVTDVDDEPLQDVVKEIISEGGIAKYAAADIRDADSVQHVVDEAVRVFGRLDIAHNNAGTNGQPGAFADVSLLDAEKVMAINFWGVLYCMKAQITQMLSQGGGAIINTASGGGMVGTPNTSVYSASKHAVLGLTRSVGAEYAALGIRINAVCPAMVNTPMVSHVIASEELTQQLLAMHPIGRFANPEEIADAVVWLASPQSSFVVGAAIAVDGGYTSL